MNYSKQRQIILDTLKENAVHPDAEFLYEKIHKKDPNISRGTLYRNLNALSDRGEIKKIDGLEAASHFDHNTYEHYHFICQNCKKIFDIKKEVSPDLIKNTEEYSGFHIKSHDIIFKGVCPECIKQSSEKTEREQK